MAGLVLDAIARDERKVFRPDDVCASYSHSIVLGGFEEMS
jgi:hypothetical protein